MLEVGHAEIFRGGIVDPADAVQFIRAGPAAGDIQPQRSKLRPTLHHEPVHERDRHRQLPVGDFHLVSDAFLRAPHVQIEQGRRQPHHDVIATLPDDCRYLVESGQRRIGRMARFA